MKKLINVDVKYNFKNYLLIFVIIFNINNINSNGLCDCNKDNNNLIEKNNGNEKNK